MAVENSLYDKKSLRTVTGKSADFSELAKDCVAFANSKGGCIDIGIEDDDELHLDCYEGYPTFYYKKEFTLPIKGIKTGKIRNRKVYVYIMHEDRPFAIPSKFYVDVCRIGYQDFGFDETYLFKALKKSKEAAQV